MNTWTFKTFWFYGISAIAGYLSPIPILIHISRSISNNSVHNLNDKTVLFHPIHFSISTQFSSI